MVKDNGSRTQNTIRTIWALILKVRTVSLRLPMPEDRLERSKISLPYSKLQLNILLQFYILHDLGTWDHIFRKIAISKI